MGDVIEVWWAPNRDTVTRIYPYKGPLEYLWPKGAVIVETTFCRHGYTADVTDFEDVVTRGPELPRRTR